MKKEILTKQQKRRLADRLGENYVTRVCSALLISENVVFIYSGYVFHGFPGGHLEVKNI